MKIRYLVSILFTLAYNTLLGQSQDTLRLSERESEVRFTENNIQLLAQKYSLDSAKANVITSKLWDNPQFGISSGLYDQVTHQFLDYSGDGNGEVAMQYSQLVKIAGKRNKAIQLAKTGVTLTEYQFFDLLRTLRYTLRSDYYNIYYLQQTEKVYNTEITSLQNTVIAYIDQVKKGNIAEKDLLRIRSQLYTLEAELVSLQNNIDDVESEFKLLIRANANSYVIPQLTPRLGQQNIVEDISYAALEDSAYLNRYDLKIAAASITFNKQNLLFQKANAIPDVNIDLGYDRLGSYVKNYNSIGVDLPLPFFNRNQGNIKQAKAVLNSSELQYEAVQDVVKSQVSNAYLGALRAERLINSFDQDFEKELTVLIGEVTRNFQQHNITLLEFTDFYDSYKQNVVQMNNLRYNFLNQLEQLNYTTGTIIFNKNQ